MRHKLDIHPVPEEVLYINELSLNWLWQHPEVREEVWERMKEKSD